MSGYSEVIQVMGAMIIFSMIMLNSNRLIHRNNVLQIQGELEQEVISLGQEIIEESLTKSYDEVTVSAAAPPSMIPEGFTATASLGPDAGETNRRDFNDFDDYDGWSDTIETAHGSFQLSAEVFYVNGTTFEATSDFSTFKKIEVTVTNDYLENSSGDLVNYQLEFIRNYYAD